MAKRVCKEVKGDLKVDGRTVGIYYSLEWYDVSDSKVVPERVQTHCHASCEPAPTGKRKRAKK